MNKNPEKWMNNFEDSEYHKSQNFFKALIISILVIWIPLGCSLYLIFRD